MTSVFNFKDFRNFIQARFREMPKSGYGQSLKLAQHLNVHTTLVSQILKGTKAFTLEQAASACEFFGMGEMETDYFLLLIQLDRCGSQVLRKNLTRQLDALRARSKELSNRLQATGKLKEEDRAIFYSDWAYSAVRQMTAIPGFQSLDAIARHLGLSRKRTHEIAEFLLAVGLCKEEKNKMTIGPASTHLESTSPWVRTHHVNWRQKSVEAMNADGFANLHYTSPMTLSRADAEVIREMISKFLESVAKVVQPSPSESLRCLNIDWFEVT